MSLMNTFEALSKDEQEIVNQIADAARDALRDNDIKPLNDDRAAFFDEACAKFFVACRDVQPSERPRG